MSRNMPQTGPQFLSEVSNLSSPDISGGAKNSIPIGGGPQFLSQMSNPSLESPKTSELPVSGGLADDAKSPVRIREGIQIRYADLAYDETKPLGKGAYGQVFQGSFRKEPVAIKVYDFRGTLSEKDREAVLHEAETMDQLRSTYVIGFRGIFLEPRYGIVMEYCAGGTLAQRLVKPEITIDYAQQLLWGKQISYGLHALHSVRIFHRDLKSDNILLDSFGQSKVADFGLSLIKSSSSTQSQGQGGSHSAAGTIPWMAPELFEGEPHSAAADIYSLGMVLWEIVARRTPFTGRVAAVIIGMVLAGKRETLPDNCPEIFKRLIIACWHADPKQRPSAGEVGDQLDAELSQVTGVPLSEIKRVGVREDEKTFPVVPTGLVSTTRKEMLGEADFKTGFGHYLTSRYRQALPYLEKSIQCDYPPAYLYLGRMYEQGFGVVKDEAASKRYFQTAGSHMAWFKRQTETGSPESQFYLGRFYESVEKDDKQAVVYYQKAADQGSALAQNSLGWCYEYGIGVIKDEKLAVTYYQKAADQGQPHAQNNLGRCYQNGIGVVKDEKQAVIYYQKAADQGHATAQNWLGWFYEKGIGIAKDEKEAIKYYQKAADQGEAYAQYNLGRCYQNGIGMVKDEKQAFVYYRRAAEQGNASALYGLGYAYQYGIGVTKDERQAVVYYQKAADQGSTSAQFSIGYAYQHGIGVVKNESQAVGYYQKAANQGDANGQCNLGLCYRNGVVVAKDEKQAVALFQKAAEQGNAAGQCNLGWCYENGFGVSKDPRQAVNFYQKAAAQGLAAAQSSLGWCYQSGLGVVRNDRMAADYYLRAASQGYAFAQHKMGWVCENGIGVEPDIKQAVFWYRSAAEQGNADAQNNLGACYHNATGVEKDTKKAIYWYQLAAAQGKTLARDNLRLLGVYVPVATNPSSTFGGGTRQNISQIRRPAAASDKGCRIC